MVWEGLWPRLWGPRAAAEHPPCVLWVPYCWGEDARSFNAYKYLGALLYVVQMVF